MNPAASATTTFAPAKPRRRWWLRGVLVLAFLGAVLLGVYLVLAEIAQRDWDAAIAETDALDPGWRLEEMLADRPKIKDEDNAALIVNLNTPKAQRVRLFIVPTYDEIFGKLPPTARLNQQQLGLIRAEFAKIPEMDATAAKLKKMPKGQFTLQYGVGYFDTSISELQNTRLIADWLRHEAMLLADAEKPDQACESCQTILNIGRAAGSEYFLISYLIDLDLQRQAISTLERVLAQGEPSEKSLREMQAVLESETRASSWLRAMRGERAGHYHLFVGLREGKVKKNLVWDLHKPTSVADWIHQTFPSTLPKHFPDDLRFMNRAVEIAKLPIHERKQKIDDWEAEARATSNPIIKRLPPAMKKVHYRDCQNHGMLRSAAAGMACEIYRKQRGSWPASLGVLVQEKLLAAVPTDPIDNQPLRYRRTKDGIVIYSIGPDGIDNQGHFDPAAKWLEPGVDFGFRLWNVDRRRQPALPPVAFPEGN